MISEPIPAKHGVAVQAGTPMTVTEDGAPTPGSGAERSNHG